MRSRAAALVLGLAVVSFANEARADDKAAADALFQAAKALVGEGRYADACPKFEASYKLDKTLGTLLNLGDCLEKLGKLATAWAAFGEAEERARKDGDSRLAFAQERRAALAQRLPKMQINVQNPQDDLRVWRDDVALDPLVYGVPLPVDPGDHRIEVRRGSKTLTTENRTLAEKESVTVNIDLGVVARAHPAPKGVDPDDGGVVVKTETVEVSNTQRVLGYTVGGIGLLAFLGAVGLEIGALVKKDEADQPWNCFEGICRQEGLDAADTGATLAEVGQWVGIGGILGIAVGATLILTAPSAPDPPVTRGGPTPPAPARRSSSFTVDGWAGPSSGGVMVRGTF